MGRMKNGALVLLLAGSLGATSIGCGSTAAEPDAWAHAEVWHGGGLMDTPAPIDAANIAAPDSWAPDADLDAPLPDANEDAPYYDAPCVLECAHLPLGCTWVRTDFSVCSCGLALCEDSGPGPDAALRGSDAYVIGDVGGVYCVANGDCPEGQFCSERPDGCGGAGACRPVPSSCPVVDGMVCGCDGRVYDSACDAAQARVSVAASGPCP